MNSIKQEVKNLEEASYRYFNTHIRALPQKQSGEYPGYHLAEMNEILTPVSKADGTVVNNLG